MPSKLKILISAYACSPYHGSEPGMGWNFVFGLSKYHEIHVITEKLKWKADIDLFLYNNPEYRSNLKFYFIEKNRSRQLRKIWPPSYYWFYKKWQKEAYNLALFLDEKEDFDIIHQLNMVGYREPGYLWKIEKPFVWGPIGGLENSPWQLLPSIGLKGLIYYSGRNIFNLFQSRFSNRVRQAAVRRNSILISATPGNKKLIKELWNVDSHLICEVGNEICDLDYTPSLRFNSLDPLIIIWSGQHTPGKNLPLLLNTLKHIEFSFELHILGSGEMTNKWRALAIKNDIHESCHWYGWVEREKAISLMKKGHVLCITSICDLTSTVTLEALSYGLPIVCLDHLGFSHIVNENCGIKIKVESSNATSIKFAKALECLNYEESYRRELSVGAINRAKNFSWDLKIQKLNEIYKYLVNVEDNGKR